MMEKEIKNTLSDDSIVAVISSETFTNLSEQAQQRAMDYVNEKNRRDAGIMGRIFGNKKELASMNIAVFICFLLILICGIDIIHSIMSGTELHMELISSIIPVVSLSIGFIFGKGGGKV